jgi:hypothetical protein
MKHNIRLDARISKYRRGLAVNLMLFLGLQVTTIPEILISWHYASIGYRSTTILFIDDIDAVDKELSFPVLV